MKLLFIIIVAILSLTILTLLYLLRKKSIILKQTEQDLQLLQFAENMKMPTRVETFTIDPFVFSTETVIDDRYSFTESDCRDIAIKDLSDRLAEVLKCNPDLVKIEENSNYANLSKTYVAKIRILPFRS